MWNGSDRSRKAFLQVPARWRRSPCHGGLYRRIQNRCIPQNRTVVKDVLNECNPAASSASSAWKTPLLLTSPRNHRVYPCFCTARLACARLGCPGRELVQRESDLLPVRVRGQGGVSPPPLVSSDAPRDEETRCACGGWEGPGEVEVERLAKSL